VNRTASSDGASYRGSAVA